MTLMRVEQYTIGANLRRAVVTKKFERFTMFRAQRWTIRGISFFYLLYNVQIVIQELLGRIFNVIEGTAELVIEVSF